MWLGGHDCGRHEFVEKCTFDRNSSKEKTKQPINYKLYWVKGPVGLFHVAGPIGHFDVAGRVGCNTKNPDYDPVGY